MDKTFTTIHDLIHGLDEAEVLIACAITDPKNADSYPEMLQELKTIEPKRTTMTVVVRPWHDEKRPGYIVSGRELGDPENYGIDFIPWAEWLGSTFAVENVDLTPIQILAECLNEMSWGGWTQQEATDLKELIVGRIGEIQDMLDDDIDETKKE